MGLPPAPVQSINLPRPGCEAPLSRICQVVWLLTARTICLSGSLAAFLRLVRAGYEPPLPPDQLELWLSSETLAPTDFNDDGKPDYRPLQCQHAADGDMVS